MARSLAILSLIAFASLFLVAAGDRETAIMDEVEDAVRLPQAAQPLESYVRKYTYLGDGTVIGVYVLATMGVDKPGRSWVAQRDMPVIADGGCSVVTVFYDQKTRRAPTSRCNGKA